MPRLLWNLNHLRGWPFGWFGWLVKSRALLNVFSVFAHWQLLCVMVVTESVFINPSPSMREFHYSVFFGLRPFVGWDAVRADELSLREEKRGEREWERQSCEAPDDSDFLKRKSEGSAVPMCVPVCDVVQCYACDVVHFHLHTVLCVCTCEIGLDLLYIETLRKLHWFCVGSA